MGHEQSNDEIEFPAHAGMNRSKQWPQRLRRGVPRTRGDEPPYAKERQGGVESSPHTRG